MPDIPNRDALEEEISRILGRLNKRQMGKLLEHMGDPPLLSNVPAEFWEQSGKEFAQAAIPFSERVYLESAARLLDTVSVGVDWTLVNENAAYFARTMNYKWIDGMNNNTRRAVGDAVARFYEEGWTHGQLKKKLAEDIYGARRVATIARTEVTRAAVEGERAVVKELAQYGIRAIEVWQTRNDELVCVICGPRHGKKEGDGWSKSDGPPAHPNCRCSTGHEIYSDEGPTQMYETFAGLAGT